MVMLAKNPFNHVGMTQKVPYMPILVVLGPKLWSVTLKLCQRAKLSVPFLFHIGFFGQLFADCSLFDVFADFHNGLLEG